MIKDIPNYVLVDLETTGCNRSDEIIEIGALRVCDHMITQSFNILVKPKQRIPIEASIVNHITDDMVANCHDIRYAVTAFDSFIKEDDILMGHNISAFDIKYLKRDFQLHINKELRNKVYDTLHCSRREMKFLGHHSLRYLSAYYGIDYTKAHRAVEDCFINYQVYEKMLNDNFEGLTKLCPECGNILKLRLGKYSWFYGCSKYPTCNHSEPFTPQKLNLK